MPRLTLYPNGVVASQTQGRGNTAPRKRGSVTGWTAGAARRNDLFLRSIDFKAVEALGLFGYAATMTLPTAPPTAADFKKRLQRFLSYTVASGAQLIHYVIEMQPRRNSPDGPVPHIHMVAFFPKHYGPQNQNPQSMLQGQVLLFVYWNEAFSEYGPQITAQHIEAIHDLRGWSRYVAKHGARSETHYQRLRGLLPAGWLKTGRVWGTKGDWPRYTEAVQLSYQAHYAFRRFATNLQLADVRKNIPKLRLRLADSANAAQRKQNQKLLDQTVNRRRYLKSRLKRNKLKIARLVPVSDWVDLAILRRWLLGACVEREVVDPWTGEVGRCWCLRGETVRPDPPFSAPFVATDMQGADV